MKQSSAEFAVNLSSVTARDMVGYFKALNENDIEGLAGFYAKVVTAGPFDGLPEDPNTYLNMNYFTEFDAVISAVNEAGKNARKR